MSKRYLHPQISKEMHLEAFIFSQHSALFKQSRKSAPNDFKPYEGPK